ncbi:MAG: hypothetical protein ACLP9L_13580 [Thermoguttaceae bacterium]
MTRTRRSLGGAIAIAGILLSTAVAALAETCTLALKRRETKPANFDQATSMYWSVRPQYSYMQMIADENGRWQPANPGYSPPGADAFKRIVRKEPKYQSDNPFRGVVKLGSQEFAFALDVAAAKEKQAVAKQATEKGATEPAEATTGKATTGEKPSANSEKPAAKPTSVKSFSYNRLYFDFNHNGDLTDDKVVEITADSKQLSSVLLSAAMSYERFKFPRIDVTINVEGTKLDYSLYLEGYAYASSNSCNVMVSANSAVCREGDITLEGKRHHVVLLDDNSNGRFDDENKISGNIHLASGQLYAEPGDMLLIDPKAGESASDSPYDATTSDYRYPVAKMIAIDGRLYDLEISPAGDKLTLTPSTVPLGSVTNRNDAFRALIYAEGKGFLKISGTKDEAIPVPEGEWKLFSYTITRAAHAVEPAKTAAEKTAKSADKAAEAKHGSLWGVLGQVAETITGGSTRPTFVSATATEKYQAVTVRKGETVELPFGPPYKPTVTAMSYGVVNGQAEQLFLEMSLVGVGGEGCTNMLVKGSRPGRPDFTVTDPDGKVVQRGSFEYG